MESTIELRNPHSLFPASSEAFGINDFIILIFTSSEYKMMCVEVSIGR